MDKGGKRKDRDEDTNVAGTEATELILRSKSLTSEALSSILTNLLTSIDLGSNKIDVNGAVWHS